MGDTNRNKNIQPGNIYICHLLVSLWPYLNIKCNTMGICFVLMSRENLQGNNDESH